MSLKDNALVQTFTGAKLVNSPVLNRLGLQVARTYGARWLYNIRPAPVDPAVRDLLRQLRTEGMVAIENFLPEAEFERVKKECFDLLASNPEKLVRKMHGPTAYTIAALREFPQAKTEAIDRFFGDKRLHALMQAAEKTRFDMKQAHRAVEHVKQGMETTQGDPETELHSDIFYHTHKAWLYLSDVEPKDAPLVFVPRSHRLTPSQAAHIYRHSCNPNKPSRRVSSDELEKMGLKEVVLQCKKNTLVVANVCGYHRRSVGQPGGERFALHCSIRLQPFAFWKNG